MTGSRYTKVRGKVEKLCKQAICAFISPPPYSIFYFFFNNHYSASFEHTTIGDYHSRL